MQVMIDINYMGVVNLAYATVLQMVERGHGEFAAISSVSGLIPPRKTAGYGATKFAVLGFLGSLRYDLMGTNVRLACVCPEQVSTPMAPDLFTDPVERARAIKMSITPEVVIKATENGIVTRRVTRTGSSPGG